MKNRTVRSMAGYLIIGALLVTCGSAALSQQADLTGWMNARWNMSEAELLAAFESKLEKLPAREKFSEMYVDHVIRTFLLDGLPFTVHFQMDDRSNRLVQVLLRFDEKSSNAPAEVLFQRIASELERQLGPYSGKQEERQPSTPQTGGGGVNLSRIWQFPTTAVELRYLWLDRTNQSLLAVAYRPSNRPRPPTSTSPLSVIISENFRPADGAPAVRLTVVSGVPLLPTGANPLGGAAISLLHESAVTTLENGRLFAGEPQRVRALLRACAANTPQCAPALQAVANTQIALARMNAAGVAEFPPLPPGTYYVWSTGRFANRTAVWNVRVTLTVPDTPAANRIVLNQDNATLFD